MKLEGLGFKRLAQQVFPEAAVAVGAEGIGYWKVSCKKRFIFCEILGNKQRN